MGGSDTSSKGGRSLRAFHGRDHRCPYGLERIARELFVLDPRVDSGVYQRLMDTGFRRTGGVFYQPVCAECRQCVPIRVPVAEFRPSRSQRRAMARNQDIVLEHRPLGWDDERFDLYVRYQSRRHNDESAADLPSFRAHLCESPIDSFETAYRLGGRLVGVGIVDVTPSSLSSVYFYFDPELSRRRLGIVSALCEIERCREMGLPYWYPGFYVPGNPRMAYKAEFRPRQVLGTDGVWSETSEESVAALNARCAARDPRPPLG